MEQGSPVPSAFPVYGLLALVGILGALGDAAINQWARTFKLEWWLLSVPIWIGAATLFGYVLRWEYFTFGIAVILALLVHSGAVILYDRVLFGTKLSWLQWAGVACAILALSLIELGRTSATQGQEEDPAHVTDIF